MSTKTIKTLNFNFPDFDQIDIYGISDLHIGHEGFNEAAFQKVSRQILSQPNNFVVLNGDLIDNAIKSSVGSPYEATMRPSEQRKMAAEILAPLRDRILTILPGNHCERSDKETDTNPVELIAERLDIVDRYARNESYLNIAVGERANHSKRPPRYCVNVIHGHGGGKLAGSGINAADYKAAVSGADLFIMGHVHKPSTYAGSRLVFDASKSAMVQRDYQIMVCTAWLEYVGYAVRGMYRPTPIAINRATLYGNEFGMETHNRTD